MIQNDTIKLPVPSKRPVWCKTLGYIISFVSRVAEFGDSRRFSRQSPNSATVAVFGDYSRQCGQGFTSANSALKFPYIRYHGNKGQRLSKCNH